jgi:hypothetical protein
MKILVVLMVLAPLGMAQGVLFEDDFEDGNYDGWTVEATGATYEVNSNKRFEFSYTGTDSIYSLAYRGDLGDSMSVGDYSVLIETITHSPTGKTGMNIRFNPVTYTGYGLYLNYETGNYYILRYDSFSSCELLGIYLAYPGGFDYGTVYWIRFECIDDILRAKIWTGGSGDEPPNWNIERTDGTYNNNGCLELESLRPDSGTHFDTEFDNVIVTSTLSLEHTTWGAIKSAF